MPRPPQPQGTPLVLVCGIRRTSRTAQATCRSQDRDGPAEPSGSPHRRPHPRPCTDDDRNGERNPAADIHEIPVVPPDGSCEPGPAGRHAFRRPAPHRNDDGARPASFRSRTRMMSLPRVRPSAWKNRFAPANIRLVRRHAGWQDRSEHASRHDGISKGEPGERVARSGLFGICSGVRPRPSLREGFAPRRSGERSVVLAADGIASDAGAFRSPAAMISAVFFRSPAAQYGRVRLFRRAALCWRSATNSGEAVMTVAASCRFLVSLVFFHLHDAQTPRFTLEPALRRRQ